MKHIVSRALICLFGISFGLGGTVLPSSAADLATSGDSLAADQLTTEKSNFGPTNISGDPEGRVQTAVINTPGPLTRIAISSDLNCDVGYLGDSEPVFYGATACGTFLFAGGRVYGPSYVPAGGSVASTPFTPLTQTGPTGTGTSADPYLIVTEVMTGVGFAIYQEDSYVVGDEFYRTDITVFNASSPRDVVLYRAADCLPGTVTGVGRFDGSNGAVGCTAGSGRVVEFVPLSPESDYLHSDFDDVWKSVGTGLPLPNECRGCDTAIDDGLGLSWSAWVQSQSAIKRSMLTRFVPPTHFCDDPPKAGTTLGDGAELTVPGPFDVMDTYNFCVPSVPSWSAVAVRPDHGFTDLVLRRFGWFIYPQVKSMLPGHAIDFIAVDSHHAATPKTYYPAVTPPDHQSSRAKYTVEVDWSGALLIAGVPRTWTATASDVVYVANTFLAGGASGRTYTITLTSPAPLNGALYLMKSNPDVSSTWSQPRIQAIAKSDTGLAGVTEVMPIFVPAGTSDWYGVVVLNTLKTGGQYTLSIA